MLDMVAMGVRLARDLPAFLRRPCGPEECERLLATQLARREDSFLEILARAVFGNPRSPYGPLMRRARVAHGDIAAWVRRSGVEAALAELYESGVYVTLDEFKGRRPIRRPGLEVAVAAHDFDNPLLAAHYEGRSGGSRGAGTRTRVDLDLLTHEAASESVLLGALGAHGRALGVWRPALPVGAGLKSLLRHARIGMLGERWFSQSELRLTHDLWRHALYTRYVIAVSRRCGRPLPAPRHTPLSDVADVARWLAGKTAQGSPAYLDVPSSAAVRVCLAARENGLDIAGTLFRVGSEPFTEARARVIAEAGARAAAHYHLAEAGRLGVACPLAASADEAHVMTGQIALLQRARRVDDVTMGALFCSTLHVAAPKVMVNVELGDHAQLTERACGCPFDRLGFRQHVHGIRSYEKLTAEGMHFVGSDLLRLVDDVLPARFGGHATDYQLVEYEDAGLSRVGIVVSPRVGEIDEAGVVATALEALAGAPGRPMARTWRDARTLTVLRREPYTTSAAKILPLHVLGRPAAS